MSQRNGAAKSHAKRDGRQHKIDTQYLINLYEKQDGKCALTGKTMQVHTLGTGLPNPEIVSVDRINNDKGYVPGNIQLVTWNTNQRKHTRSVKQFLAALFAKKDPLARRIAKVMGA